MNMKWPVPDAVEQELQKPPSGWFYAGLYVLIELIAVALTIWKWPKGQTTMSEKFLLDIVIAPALLTIALCCMLHSKFFEDLWRRSRWWNLLRTIHFANWQHWARAHLVLIDSVVLTAEKDLAARMLGLEPSPPINPKKALQIGGVDASVGESRQEQVMERLLTHLTDAIKKVTRNGKLEVLLHASDESQKLLLERSWRKLDLPGQPEILWLPLGADVPLLDAWFNEQVSDYQLVIALQLHERDEAGTFSEAGVAVLITTPKVFARAKDLKASACILRAIYAEPETAGAALTTLLRAEQAPQKKIRHLWFSNLEKQMKNATAGAARDADLSVQEQDLDRALGLPGPVTGWLIQALAAEMVKQSQGAQLVVTPRRGGAALNLVSVAPSPVKFPPEQHVPLLSVVWAIGMLSLSLFALCLHKIAPGVMNVDLTLWLCIAFMLLIPLQYGAASLDRERDTKSFRERFN
ncbi:hypothetical protein [Caballeronia zhejiangensis]|uniref:hypothetical protein n=1 Tax=Caballeronia zhejiangensis TaxID=871203 RepID=UPI00094ECF01|nr:hypothetical protein [Caballeronia zhejiangensis]